MNVFVCIDDEGGMLFGTRRVSRDRAVIDDLLASVPAGRLRVNRYSLPLFPEGTPLTVVDGDVCDGAADDDGCFVENSLLAPHAEQIGTLTLYRWNRHYPSTMKFDLSLAGKAPVSRTEFPGSSHEKITKEVYIL